MSSHRASSAPFEPAHRDPLVGGLAALTLAFYLATAQGYGYFRDELYYLACAEHLGWGYVDHPPLIGLLSAAVRAVLGHSLLAIRALPALAAALTVWLAGQIAAELGGGRFARATAALATLLAPVYLSLFSFLSMNAFDILLWAGGWWILARLLRSGDERWWLAFGAVCGVALENKISILFLGAGVAVGLLLSRRWQSLRSRHLWLGGALALALFVPHLIWQQVHGWPSLEFMDNARRFKMEALSPAAFFVQQILFGNPGALLLWLAGLGYLLLARPAAPFRLLGWAPLTVLVVMALTHAKPYYPGPVYTLLFASGAVAFERWTRGRTHAWRAALLASVVLGGAVGAPLAKPLLPLDTFRAYSAWLGLEVQSGERHDSGGLPQHFADMHGWPELAASVAEVYHALPAADRELACVFAQNYGQAGAIDLFGPPLGLPGAISGHNSYSLWGPGDCEGGVLIVIGDHRERLEELFETVELGGRFTCDNCIPYEADKPIWVARQPRQPLDGNLWRSIRRFI